MNSYPLAVISLTLALFAQCIATGVATAAAVRPPYRRGRMALAIGLGLLALQHAFALELALQTGIHDLTQALLAAGVSLLLLIGFSSVKPRPAEMPPPR